jgi:hypothetical protein
MSGQRRISKAKGFLGLCMPCAAGTKEDSRPAPPLLPARLRLPIRPLDAAHGSCALSAFDAPGLVIEDPRVVIHEAYEPDVFADFADSDFLTDGHPPD